MKKHFKKTLKLVGLTITSLVLLLAILAKNNDYSGINTTLPANQVGSPLPQVNPNKDVTDNGIPFNKFKSRATIEVDTATNTFYIYEIRDKTMSVFEAESNLMAINGVKEITLNLHSPGGSLFAAHVILEQIKILKERGIKVNTVVESQNACMSACLLIFLAGDTRTASGDSVFMFHAPYVQFSYNTPEPVYYVVQKDLRNDREEFANILGKACPADQRIKLDVLDHKEHYYTANQLVTKCTKDGFFTNLIEKPDPQVVQVISIGGGEED
jgi:ATP-dependent protease ClpP protease subunit